MTKVLPCLLNFVNQLNRIAPSFPAQECRAPVGAPGPQLGRSRFPFRTPLVLRRPLESLGPNVGKIFIQAKDDSYEKTRQSMEKAKRKNAMNW